MNFFFVVKAREWLMINQKSSKKDSNYLANFTSGCLTGVLSRSLDSIFTCICSHFSKNRNFYVLKFRFRMKAKDFFYLIKAHRGLISKKFCAESGILLIENSRMLDSTKMRIVFEIKDLLVCYFNNRTEKKNLHRDVLRRRRRFSYDDKIRCYRRLKLVSRTCFHSWGVDDDDDDVAFYVNLHGNL